MDGSVVSSYSTSGILLAIAAKSPKDRSAHVASHGGGGSACPGTLYAMSIIDSDTGEKLWSDELAHFGVIYGIRMRRSFLVLLSVCNSFIVSFAQM